LTRRTWPALLSHAASVLGAAVTQPVSSPTIDVLAPLAPLAAQRRSRRLPAAPTPRLAAAAAGLIALLVVSLWLRTRWISAYFWIDEGLSVGISSHHLTAIPGVLRQDGSPPLYYLILHVWMMVVGRSEAATHSLSVLIALLTVPAALWTGRSLFGARCGWFCAALAATDPFLTAYAQEARMYELVALLSLLASAAFVRAFLFLERRYVAALAITLAALLYTHTWGIFLVAAMVGTTGMLLLRPELTRLPVAAGGRRRVLIDGVLAFGGAALLFAPWIPTLLYQSAHTGAPWALAPTWGAAEQIPLALLGGAVAGILTLITAGVGLYAGLRSGPQPRIAAARALALVLALTMASAWSFSKLSPAWANRYFAIFLGPFLLLVAFGLTQIPKPRGRPRPIGAAAMAALAVIWVAGSGTPRRAFKSNVAPVAARVGPTLRPGDVVFDTHPEEVPVIVRYMPPGLRYVTPLGPVADPRFMDWQDALARLRASRVETSLPPLLRSLAPGARLVFIQPVINGLSPWRAPWTRLVKIRSTEWSRALAADRALIRLSVVPGARHVSAQVPVRATVFEKRGSGSA